MYSQFAFRVTASIPAIFSFFSLYFQQFSSSFIFVCLLFCPFSFRVPSR